MSSWVNRTVLTGTSVDANGTNSHTCTFTAATAGNFLIAIIAGSVTSTTPSGWALVQSAVNFSGLYMFTKTASSGESSFTTTHNGSNFPIRGVVYEFLSGTSVLNSNSQTAESFTATGPTVPSLTGTYTRFAARSVNVSGATGSTSCAWTLPTVEDYDDYVPSAGTDGISLTIAYDDNTSGTSFTPSSAITNTSNGTPSAEGLAFALSVPTSSGATTAWLSA